VATAVNRQERRDFSRIALRRPATLEVTGRRIDCELLDISLRGALVRIPARLIVGAGLSCTLTVRLDQGISTIRMKGLVAHAREGTLGMRCRELDLDGIAHLRRLLEVNLGEDALLRRELAALVRRG